MLQSLIELDKIFRGKRIFYYFMVWEEKSSELGPKGAYEVRWGLQWAEKLLV